MGRSELAAQQRMQLEAVLEEFERALRTASEGALPELEPYLAGFQGEAREYLQREMRTLLKDLVRGNYVVLNPIESGGMGSVSKVRHLRLGKVMALKEIRAEALQVGDQDEILRRFRREIEVCGRLDEHPNIVSYTDTGVHENGVPFLVMDFIDGEDLGKIVRRLGPLPISDAARIIHDAAIGLAHAHDNDLVHRDVKPSNIMVSRHGTVKVLDFGLARITSNENQLTALTTGKVMGTFDYMSPELCREITPDSRGDIYSLGCTLYFLLAGRAPFEAKKSQFEKMNAHLHAQPDPIPRLDDHPELTSILQKMIAKEPHERYQNLHQVADALRPFCEGTDLRRLVRSAKPRPGGDGATSGGILLRTDDRHDDPSRITDSKAGDQTAAWSDTRRQRSRRRSAWTACLVVVGLLAVATLLIADQWRRAQHRRDMEVVLGSMPGLNGRWWFEETPWLLPDVRLQLAESLGDADDDLRQQFFHAIYRDSNAPAAYDQLESLKARFRRHWPSDVRSHLAAVESLDPEVVDAEDFSASLRQIAVNLDSKPRDVQTAAELHLRAVIYHHLEEFDPARRAYAAAAERYGAKQPGLRALCLLDWAELLYAFRQPGPAQGKFREAYQSLLDARPGQPLPPLFALYTQAMEADAQRRIENLAEAEALLDRAWRIAATLPEAHPLRAFVHERRGWLHLDRWRLDEARQDFQTALKIREGHEPENHRARHFIYWDKQGIAMVEMYAGQTPAAQQLFQSLLERIDAGSTHKQRRELEDRRPNLYERLGDTALFDPRMQTGERDAVDPLEALENAIQTAERQNFAADGRKAVLIRLQYKAAVLHAARNAPEEGAQHIDEARRLEAESSATESSASARSASYYTLTKRMALAALAWRSLDASERNQGRKNLSELIASAGSALRRDDLLLLLFIGEELLNSQELAATERTELAKRMRQLIRLQAFPPPRSGQSNTPPRVPGVFERYLQKAEEVLAAKE